MKYTLLEIVQEKKEGFYDRASGVPRSTQWARQNKERVAARDKARLKTLDGKLTSLIINSRNRIKTGAKKLRSLEHNIDTAYLKGLWELQDGLCAVSGMPMVISASHNTPEFALSISLDRIDSSVGYVEGNVQLVCTGVNIMKNTMSMAQFVEFCNRVSEKHK